MDWKDFLILGIGLVLVVVALIIKKKGKGDWKEFVIRFAGLGVMAWVIIAVVNRLG
ncbi:MAG: hypothetical protein IJ427_09240 [Lachnospiraceae bacterium]|nr:hypothetical protein [Lachnospiraceae bacterium]MBQ8548670.1 hypothetical protein [Lachnospiraceae bacterium]MBQ8846462.1 hypothetical protein [Lachnospiraceae bacterium]